jgi:histidyl-tRNA synthetase
MTDKIQSTDSYKGVRDFYPEDVAVQRYIFEVWAQTAESFGFERYDASVLEPADLYKAKGAENEEMVNEQTYTFIDRGDREVTLRPEMTPTVARMVAGKRRELSFPVRWYSIPNLFRYERPQRGRLREHWQLNCDIFGATDYTADVEIIALAYQMLINFGADSKNFVIRINHRRVFVDFLQHVAKEAGMILSEEQCRQIFQIRDRKSKISNDEYITQLEEVIGKEAYPVFAKQLHERDNTKEFNSEGLDDLEKIGLGLIELGITNIERDSTISRGFNYYTGVVFEIFDVSGENNRAMLGGGRYDNLTEMFGGEAITGIGFGMGDVTMRDFLETHDLLTSNITAPDLMVIPTDPKYNLQSQQIAMEFRNQTDMSATVDISSKKLGKKIGDASDRMVDYIIVVGDDEAESKTFTLKYLNEEKKIMGTIAEIIKKVTDAVI